jgi:hypothetical protein
VAHLIPRQALVLILSTLIAWTGSGCALLFWFPKSRETVTNRPILPPIPNRRQAVQFDVFFVDRVIGDPLNDALWKSLNQASGDLEQRVRLRQAGIQYGIAPKATNFALTQLLDPKSSAFGRQTRRQSTEIFSGDGVAEINAAILTGKQLIPSSDKSRSEPIEAMNGRCMFRVAADCVQEGWFKVTFLPEIHHGESRIRAFATEREWGTQSSQNIEPYFDRQFSVELNIGEYVVIGMSGDKQGSLGDLFFRGGDPEQRLNSLMIVRLNGMQEIEAVRQSTGTP